MDKSDTRKSKEDFIKAYKKARKPVAPAEKVIPDKRDKQREKEDEDEIRNA